MSTTQLPPEMIADVLSRLPVKSLLRFRSTSKPLCSMIDGPDFAKRHLNLSAQTLTNQKIVLARRKLHSVDLPSLERAVEMEHPLKVVHGNVEVIGSCNGLLCLSDTNAQIVVLWNMSTRKHHPLPQIPIKFPDLRYIAHGFGYDSVHDDYKVMKIVRFGHLNSHVMIYSLKSNSWERIGAFPYKLAPYRSMGVFAQGAIHWIVKHPEEEISAAAFDLATKAYRVVPLVKVKDTQDKCGFEQVKAWENRFCEIRNYAGKRTDVWAQNRNGSSWDKLLSISDPQVLTSFHHIVPMAYLSNGNELLLLQDNNKFLRYDLKTNKVRDVMSQGMPTPFDPNNNEYLRVDTRTDEAKYVVRQGMPPSFDAVLYVESLVEPFPMVNGDDATVRKRKSGGRMSQRGMVSCPKDSSWFYEQCGKRKGRTRALG